MHGARSHPELVIKIKVKKLDATCGRVIYQSKTFGIMGKDISQKLEAGFKIYININESKIILKRPQE